MTRIGNVDQIMILLRQQLQRMDRSAAKVRAGRVGSKDRSAERTAVDRIVPLAGVEELGERDFEKALVRALLSDELGPELAEDHRFERVASEVCRIIDGDRETRKLLTEAVAQIREQRTAR